MRILRVLLIGVLVTSGASRAATGVVSGTVAIEGDGPAVGANVVLLDTRLGAAVRADGSFSIAAVPPGTYKLQARLVGYEQAEQSLVRVSSGDTVFARIVLRQQAIELRQVTVTGERRQAAEDVRPSVTSLTPRESKILPGAAEDVLRSLQALPGVTSVSDFSSQLVVRGSGPDQNLIMIDGFEVLNPYRLYGFVSMFNPETVSDISLQTGGFAAEYGDRLSAVLDVKNREGRPDVPAAGKVNASLTNMNVILEGGVPYTTGSYIFSARRTYYDLILGPVLKSARLVQGDVALPNFRDLQGKVAIPLGGTHKLFFNLFTSRDGVELVSGTERDRPDSVNVSDVSHNTLAGAAWQFNPSKNVIAQTRVSWYRNRGTGSFDGTFVDPSQNTGTLGRADTFGIRLVSFGVDYDYVYEKISLGQKILWSTGRHTVEAGFGVDQLRTDFIRFFEIDPVFKQLLTARGLAIPTDAVETLTTNRYALYIQDRVEIGERLFIQPGVRLDMYPVLRERLTWSPRLNVSYKVDELSTLRAAFGVYSQSPGMEKQDMRNRVVFSERTLAGLVAEQARHYVLGYDRMVTAEWQFKAETYYKSFSSIIEPEKLTGSTWSVQRTGEDIFRREGWTTPVRVSGDSLTTVPVNDGTGRSYGIELMLQKIRSHPEDLFTGWVSYALSSAERERDGIVSPFLFDQRHAVNVVGNYRFAESWDIGARFTLRSGRPFARALGVQPRIVLQKVNGEDVYVPQTDTQGRVILDVAYERESLTGRLNLYHTLDLRITTYPSWWGLRWALYLDIQNAYNRQNQQQVRYFIDNAGALQERPVFGIPIFPSLGLSVEL
ncbi:MAG: TonB-dependent receptor plug [Bacteroidetes bacterium]|nr:TonB-dependent receptor plug [Bacteroidota bacterium]